MESTENPKAYNRIRNNKNITFNVECGNKQNADKTYTVYLRISHFKNHRRKKIFTIQSRDQFIEKAKPGIRKKKAQFGHWIVDHPQKKKLNTIIEDEIKKAKEAALELEKIGIANKETIIQNLKGGELESFIEFAKSREKYFYETGSYRNFKKYRTFLNKLNEFQKGEDLIFSEINLEYLYRFELFLKGQSNSHKKGFGLHKNTIARQMIVFRAILQNAIESKLMKAENSPFLSYKPKEEKVSKEKLSIEEINAIQGLELSRGSLLDNSRNMFLFSFYCAGIRAGDLLLLKWGNITEEGRIEYVMGKTTLRKSIKLFPPALEILNLYRKPDSKSNEFIFPMLDNEAEYAKANTSEERNMLPVAVQVKMYRAIEAKNAVINKYLKIIAGMAEIKKPLSFHISRHSFANIARKKNTNVYDVSKMLGHSSIKITETYLQNFDNESQDKSMERVYE